MTQQYTLEELPNLTHVKRVVFNSPGELQLRQAKSASLKASAEASILGRLTFEIDGKTMTISMNKKLLGLFDTDHINIAMELPEINEIHVNGSGKVHIKDVSANEFIADVNGSGQISIDNVKANSFTAKLMGSGGCTFRSVDSNKVIIDSNGSGNIAIEDVTTKTINAQLHGNGRIDIRGTGNVSSQEIKLSGSGHYRAATLISNSALIDLSGNGSVELHATDRLEANIEGNGDIVYHGTPPILKLQSKGRGNVTEA